MHSPKIGSSGSGCLLLAIAALCGCARDVHAVFPSSPDTPTGTVELVLTRPAKDLTVAIDGKLVATRRHTDRVHIANVTAGMVEIMVAAGSGPARVERHVRVPVDVGEITTVPIAAPAPSQMATLPATLLSALLVVAIRLATGAFL